MTGSAPAHNWLDAAQWRPSLVGYAVGVTAASLVYVGWFVFVTDRIEPESPEFGLGFRLLFGLFFWVAGGFGPMLLVLIIPWALAVSAYRKFRRHGQFYFPGVGAFVLFILGCAGASLSPKPLFIEDQTFLQGAAIAAERQGIGFLLAGLAFGVSYWWFGERQISTGPKQAVTHD